MMKARDIARKLKEIRKAKKLPQEHVAGALGLSPSQISRIESGKRGLAIDQLAPWAESLGVRAELTLWQTEGGLEGGMNFVASELDDDGKAVLQQVAATLPHMTPQAREALVHIMKMLRSTSAITEAA